MDPYGIHDDPWKEMLQMLLVREVQLSLKHLGQSHGHSAMVTLSVQLCQCLHLTRSITPLTDCLRHLAHGLCKGCASIALATTIRSSVMQPHT